MTQVENVFDFEPAAFVPFRDKAVLQRVRQISRDELVKHDNPDLDIQIVSDGEVEFRRSADMLARIRDAGADGREIVILTGNPNPGYVNLAHLINRSRIDCSKLHVFIVDEWADQDGRIAPESYPQGFMHAMKKYFYHELDRALRPAEQNIHGPNNDNINDYSKMLADFGGADACYTGSGWSGHMAFIDPDSPELDLPLAEWKQVGTRVVTLSPYTILQNSLHASFGRSGDAAAVPPRAATIGPADILGAKSRMDVSGITIGGSATSWQRLTTRLMLHGPVTPLIPNSILQTVPTTFLISETVAANLKPTWYEGY